jgi:hypothetical protein
MANRRRSALVVGFLVPALACTAVTGLGKSYQYLDDAAPGSGDASTADSVERGDASSADTSPGIMCPILIGGAYSMSNSGDCGSFEKSAKECVSTTTGAVSGNCALQFAYPGMGINGTLDAQADGGFRNGALMIGGVRHVGCVATWTAPATLTVACPSGGGNACTVTMTRLVASCT